MVQTAKRILLLLRKTSLYQIPSFWISLHYTGQIFHCFNLKNAYNCLFSFAVGSFVFGLYNFFYGNNFPLYAIPDELGTKTIRHSYLERKWVLEIFQAYGKPDTFVSLHTCNRIHRIGRYVPDFVLFSSDMKTVREVGLFQGRIMTLLKVINVLT